MPTSSIVLTLVAPPSRCRPLIRQLWSDGRLTVGRARGRHLPVVLDTDSLEEAVALVEELSGRNDVLHVDVVTIDFRDCA